MSRRRRKKDPLDVVRWRVWYIGGKVVSGRSFGGWQKLPEDGVLSVVVWFRDGTNRIMQGDDFYFATADGIYAHDSSYSAELIEKRYPGASVKRGKWTTDAEMVRVAEEVTAVAIGE